MYRSSLLLPVLATLSALPSIRSGSLGSASDCSAYCYAQNVNNVYSAYITTSGQCSCASNSFPANSVVTGNAGGCGSNYEVSITHTTFQFKECIQGYGLTTPVDAQSGNTDFYSILKACPNSDYVAIYPTGPNPYQFLYSCGTGFVEYTSPEACAYQVNHIYFHPADARASGLARRQMVERRRLAEQEAYEAVYCPRGLTACQLEGDSTSFECIDTKNELESCGGCLFGAYNVPGLSNITAPIGTDCSTIQGVSLGHSSCISGECQFDCQKGWQAKNGKCVKAK
ncbi:uncharacterized protein L201_005851 [Kwoniella dendrophila CBS 6074]|uniref:Protein CPL1-like domain-containing protein n=1 Tax=Kwoniella dendrophila CBS 6074 TaxID=1295534 RepID=A0AAX4K2E2_9TREE